jgi:hypothetical protein
LIHRGVQITFFLLVLPSEEVLLPDVGESLAAAGLGGSLLERELFSGRVRRNRVLMLEKLAEIEEVSVRGRPLRERDRLPFFDEFGRCHAPAIAGISGPKIAPSP